MNSGFSEQEKKKFKLKKHIKNHSFEYILDFIGPMLLTIIILNLCKSERIWLGVVLSFFYSLGRISYDIYTIIKIGTDSNR